MTIKIKFFLRNLFNRCILCGDKKHNAANCLYCIKFPQLCHAHAKIYTFGEVYGMSKERLLKELNIYE